MSKPKGVNPHKKEFEKNQTDAYIDGDKKQIVIRKQESEGIIPDPQTMAGYKEIDPKFPDMIMSWTDENLDFQRKMISRSLKYRFMEALLNNLFGLIAVACLCATGLVFAHWGHPKTGGLIICSTVAATASIFVLKKMGKIPDTKDEVE